MVRSSHRMGLSFCLLYVVLYARVFGKIQYNTYPIEVPSPHTVHVPRVLSKTCLLKPMPGPCRGNIRMYYYNPEIKNCTSFRWGGCQGNGNRFDRRSDCMNTCLSKDNERRHVPRYCSLTFDYGYCFSDMKRWYFDKYWKVCKETIYSGCGGNKNNFYNFNQCDRICRLGLDMLETPSTKSGARKVLYINHPNSTAKRSRNQLSTLSSQELKNVTETFKDHIPDKYKKEVTDPFKNHNPKKYTKHIPDPYKKHVPGNKDYTTEKYNRYTPGKHKDDKKHEEEAKKLGDQYQQQANKMAEEVQQQPNKFG